MISAWNVPLPPDFNLHNMYLSHATMPEWDVNRVLSKAIEYSLAPPITNNISVTDTFQRFPLLAPALMSIVVGHTMTLSPNELMTLHLANTNNNSTNKNTGSNTNNSTDSTCHLYGKGGKRLGVYPSHSGFDDKRALKIWQLLQPLTRRKPVSSSSPQNNNEDNRQEKADGKKKKVTDDENKNSSDNNGDDHGDDKRKDDSVKEMLASYVAYFEDKCTVTTYVLGQMAILHSYISDDAGKSRLSEIDDDDDDDDDDEEEEDDEEDDDNDKPESSSSSGILPLDDQFNKRSKEMYIPVS
ncbi:hypothetical protein BC941DRAFT_433937 [Chlamydoabsidia padenii]|nr:hypothetical protein BC941DRAFT_433937 [Chlamydoabsidia padenii]